MTGISDLPFRQTAAAQGAGYLSTEMVACAALRDARPDAIRRAAIGEGLPLMVVQLVGHDRASVVAGARLAEAAGADMVDLNFGCPAKQVTGVSAGAALMRRIGVAADLVAAAAEAVAVPVTVKMRLGWDQVSQNAPELAFRAQEAGARAVTVHGRTRAQFYSGTADWAAVREVVRAVEIPVMVNGDIDGPASAREALAVSGAAGVMIGRASLGRPWLAGWIGHALAGRSTPQPDLGQTARILADHLLASVRFYGEALGVRMFRKHLAAYIEQAIAPVSAPERREARGRICRLETAREVLAAVAGLWRLPGVLT